MMIIIEENKKIKMKADDLQVTEKSGANGP